MARLSAPLAIAFAAILAVPALAAGPEGTVKGSYTIKGKVYKAAHVYAVAKPDSFDKTKEGVELLFTMEPVAEKDLADMMPGSGPRMQATIGADGSLYGIVFLYDGGSYSSSGTSQAFEKKAMDATHIAGRVYAKSPIDMKDGKGNFDLTFDSPLFREKKAPPPTAAEKAAAAKSPQAKAFEAYLKALHAKDLAALKKAVMAEAAKELASPEAKEMLGLMEAMAPKKVEYLRVTESGDKATLEAKAEDGSVGTIDCAREGGAWKIGKQSWKGGN